MTWETMKIFAPIMIILMTMLTLLFLWKRQESLIDEDHPKWIRLLNHRALVIIWTSTISIGIAVLLFFTVGWMVGSIWGVITIGPAFSYMFMIYRAKAARDKGDYDRKIKGWKSNASRQVRREQIRRGIEEGRDVSDVKGYNSYLKSKGIETPAVEENKKNERGKNGK